MYNVSYILRFSHLQKRLLASSVHIHVFSPILRRNHVFLTLWVFRPIQLNWTSSIPCVVTWHLLLQVKCSGLNISHHPLQCANWKSSVWPSLTRAILDWRRINHVTSCCIINLLKDEVWPVAKHLYIRPIEARQVRKEEVKAQQLPRSFVHKSACIHVVKMF